MKYYTKPVPNCSKCPHIHNVRGLTTNERVLTLPVCRLSNCQTLHNYPQIPDWCKLPNIESLK